MLKPSLAVVVTAVAVAVPGWPARAASDADALVRDIAAVAADVVAEEAYLLGELTAAGGAAAVKDPSGVEARLRSVDAHGRVLLDQLDRLDGTVTPAVRAALGELPADLATAPPGAGRYDDAIDDLVRLAGPATGGRSAPGTPHGSSIALLAVAAAALVTLGLAALANALRRTPDRDLASMAWSDGLTGLANRRRLDHDLAAGGRSGAASTAVIMIDVDHFKAVNDTHGHRVGDEVLKRVGEMLSDNVRRDDVVYRYGGEEFCILLPGATASDGRIVAERIVAASRGVELPGGGNITISVGIAEGPHERVDETLQQADEALFQAKRSGRDRAVFVVTDEPSASPL